MGKDRKAVTSAGFIEIKPAEKNEARKSGNRFRGSQSLEAIRQRD
jgi:hypothetical protein